MPSLLAAGLLLGAVHAALTARLTAAPVRDTLVSAVLSSIPALALGLVLWVLLLVATRFAAVRRALGRVDRLMTIDQDEDRGRVVHRQALLVVVPLLLLVVAFGFHVVLRKLWTLQDSRLGLDLAVGLALGLAVGLPLVVLLLVLALARPLGWIDARFGLPRPRSPGLRFLLFVALPLFVLLELLLRRHVELVRPVADAVDLALTVLLAIVIGLLVHHLPDGRPRLRRGLRVLGYSVWGISAAAVLVGFNRLPPSVRAAEHTGFASLGIRFVQAMTDFDGDGASSLLGGGDCAPFNPHRGPSATDVPGNGIDEDCDGRDASPPKKVGIAPRPLFSGKLSKEQIQHYNIVWIIVDAMRADHLGIYGYKYPTSPNMDAFARRSLLFKHAYSQASATNFSFPSMFTGHNPAGMAWYKNHGYLQPSVTELSIASRLRGLGYATGMTLSPGPKRAFTGLQRGFGTVLNLQLGRSWRRWMDHSSPTAATLSIEFMEKVLRSKRKRPFFLVSYFPDPHFGYVRQAEVAKPFPKTRMGNYDTEIAFADKYIGFLLQYIAHRNPIRKNTIVLITADHGEEFHEHGHYYHATRCYTESIHVPLIVHIPGIKPEVIQQPVGLVDIVPTLLELLGAPHEGKLDGQSLLIPALAPELVSPDRPLFCSIASQRDAYTGNFYRRSVRSGRYALVEGVIAGKRELFDIKKDPGEHHDLSRNPGETSRISALHQLLVRAHTGNLTSHKRFKQP